MKSNMRTILLVSAAIFPLASASAWAEEAAVADAGTKDAGVAEIIVTAQKKSENLQKVPIAVSAFSQSALQDRGLTGGADLKNAIPNVSFNDNGFGKFNFQIRGIGAPILGSSADSGVGIHENNIPLTVNRLPTAEFYDVERVEVLRGPQGTLYGRNATGGVVNNITATPKDTFSAQATGEYASYNRIKVTGYVNLPMSDTFALRVAGTLIKRDGDTLNAGTGQKVNSRNIFSTRITAQWKPSSDLRIRAMWEHFDQNDTTGGNGKLICAPDAGPTSIGGVATDPVTQGFLSTGCLNTAATDPHNNGVAPSISEVPGLYGFLTGVQGINSFAGKVVSTDLHTIEAEFNPYTIATNDLASLDIEYKISPSLTLTSLSAYTYDKYNFKNSYLGGIPTSGLLLTGLSGLPGVNSTTSFTDPQLGMSSNMMSGELVRTTGSQYSQELRLQSNYSGMFNFNLGGMYLDYKATGEVFAFGNTSTIAAELWNPAIYVDPKANPDGTGHHYYLSSSPYHLKAAAAFGEAYFQATDTLKATLGLRYTNDSKDQTSYPIVQDSPGQGFPATTPQHVDFSELTGRFTVDWQPTRNNLIYASYSRGYKGGGFNPAGVIGAIIGPFYKPEFVNSFEVGTKNSLLDHRLTLNLTGFYYDYKNYQIAQVVGETVGTNNVNATVKGLEFEAAFQPVRALRFDTQIGYLDAKIKDGSSIDQNDLTQGDPTLAVVHSTDPATFGGACVVPITDLAALQAAINHGDLPSIAMSSQCSGTYADPNAFGGVPVQLRGHQLPNSPHVTVSFGTEYAMDIDHSWRATLRADYHWQSSSYATMFNTTFDLTCPPNVPQS